MFTGSLEAQANVTGGLRTSKATERWGTESDLETQLEPLKSHPIGNYGSGNPPVTFGSRGVLLWISGLAVVWPALRPAEVLYELDLDRDSVLKWAFFLEPWRR